VKRVFVVIACILLGVPGIICQEKSAPLFRLRSWDDIPRGFSEPPQGMDKTRSPFAVLPQAGPARGGLTLDLHHFATDDLATAGGSSFVVRRPVKKLSHDHSYLIELTAENWHPLSDSEKLRLFSRDLLHWDTHVSLALDAGLSLAINDRSFLGRGGYGYLRRYGYNVADEANFVFFSAYLFPTLFHEDPRYIPMDQGTKRVRTAYAISRVVLTRNDAGGTALNKSLILGTVVSSAIASAYYSPAGGSTGAGVIFANAGISLASDAGYNLLKEYWPNVAAKLKLNLWMRNVIRSLVRDSVRVN